MKLACKGIKIVIVGETSMQEAKYFTRRSPRLMNVAIEEYFDPGVVFGEQKKKKEKKEKKRRKSTHSPD